MGGPILLTAQDGHELRAYRATPSGNVLGRLVVVQEIFGVNGHIRSVCDGFADAGFEVVAPALFDRAEAGIEIAYDGDGVARGRELRARVGNDNAVMDIAAAVAAQDGPVGVVGYCWGGALAWLAATRLGPACAVSYYGSQIIDYIDEKPVCPVLLHYGEMDSTTPAEQIAAVRGAHPDIPLYLYPAGHGFNCDLRADFHAESAALARLRTLAFFAEHLG